MIDRASSFSESSLEEPSTEYKRTGASGLPSDVAARLLDKLSTDDVFRDLFQNDSAAALKQVGAPEGCAACLTVTKLASKDAIKATKHALLGQLTGTLDQTPVHLNAR